MDGWETKRERGGKRRKEGKILAPLGSSKLVYTQQKNQDELWVWSE